MFIAALKNPLVESSKCSAHSSIEKQLKQSVFNSRVSLAIFSAGVDNKFHNTCYLILFYIVLVFSWQEKLIDANRALGKAPLKVVKNFDDRCIRSKGKWICIMTSQLKLPPSHLPPHPPNPLGSEWEFDIV